MLNKHNVRFNHEEHTYMLPCGKMLSGITKVLSRYITPNKYEGVPAEILEQAKERGDLVHADIGLWINGFREEPTPETEAFINWAEDKDLKSECLVSDGENYASSIDVVEVLSDLPLIKLYDIKTTYKVDEDYCRWQLSIYAYFANLAGYEVDAISVLHVRDGKCVEVPLEFIGKMEVKSLLSAAALGEPWNNPFVSNSLEEAQVNEICLLEQAIKQLDEQRKMYESRLNEFKEGILDYMKANGVTKIDTERITIGLKKASQRATIDTKALKAECPEIAEKYTKVTEVKESLTIKIK